MTHPTPIYTTLYDWISHEAIPFSVDSTATVRALNAESFTDFDCLAFFDSTDYARGGWPLEGLSASPKQECHFPILEFVSFSILWVECT